MTVTRPGDIVDIVLDVIHVSEAGQGGGEHERVLVQGVFPSGGPYPPMLAGAARNVVQVFFGHHMHGVAAFLIETALTAGGQVASYALTQQPERGGGASPDHPGPPGATAGPGAGP